MAEMTKELKSIKLFQEGLALKRKHMYDAAIKKYVESILIYPDDPDLGSVYYAMGKAYYLAKDYKMSYIAYKTYWFLVIVPDMIEDYHAYQRGTIAKLNKERLENFFEQAGRHIGHVYNAVYNSNSYFSNPAVKYYRVLISGGNIDDSKAKLLKPLDDECREIGIRVLIGWLMDYENDFPKYKNDVMQYMSFFVL